MGCGEIRAPELLSFTVNVTEILGDQYWSWLQSGGWNHKLLYIVTKLKYDAVRKRYWNGMLLPDYVLITVYNNNFLMYLRPLKCSLQILELSSTLHPANESESESELLL